MNIRPSAKTHAWRGLPGLNWDMISKVPEGSFYLGGGGGILNAILGSLYLATGATLLASLIAVPVVLYIHTYAGKSRLAASPNRCSGRG